MGTLAGHPYLSRPEWGARPPRGVTPVSLPSERVYVHHTAGHERGAAGMRTIQAGHMRPEAEGGRGFRDIAYSFVIDGDDGVIYEGRGPGVQGGHVHGAENRNHGVCVMGNFENEPLTDVARRSLVDLLRHGHAAGWWQLTVLGHRQEPGHEGDTACPGRHLYAQLDELRRAITQPPAPPEVPDMDVTERKMLTEIHAALFAARPPGELVRQVWGGLRLTDFQSAEGTAADLMRRLVVAAGGDVDEVELARQVLTVLTPEAIAAALGREVGDQVVDAFHRRTGRA